MFLCGTRKAPVSDPAQNHASARVLGSEKANTVRVSMHDFFLVSNQHSRACEFNRGLHRKRKLMEGILTSLSGQVHETTCVKSRFSFHIVIPLTSGLQPIHIGAFVKPMVTCRSHLKYAPSFMSDSAFSLRSSTSCALQ